MLKLQNISKYYHSNDVVALGLRKVSLEFALGEFVAVTGESGSGKSTLLNVISGLDTYEDGEMYVNGEETSYFSVEDWESYRRQYIGFVFQNYNIIDSYSVLENVMLALTIQGYDKATRKQRALELIDRVGLTSHVHHKASKLSGGQKQRAVIARALAKDCPIIVADEPTGNLDSESGENIMRLLKEISEDKLVIVVTHNYDQVKDYATRKIRLFDGEVVEDKTIRKRKDVETGVTLAGYHMTLLTLIGIAFRNMFRTPRRTIFTLIVAIFISAVFTFVWGAFNESLNTSYYGGIYENVTDRRIIVTKFDETPFTQAELDTLAGLDRVNYLLEHDILNESYVYDAYQSYGYTNYNYNYVNPAAMLSPSDLKRGRLPQSEFEIVTMDYEEYQIGDRIEVFLSDPYQFRDGASAANGASYEFEIVGIAKQISQSSWYRNLYFHDDFLNNDRLIGNAYVIGAWGDGYVRYSYEAQLGAAAPIQIYSFFSFRIDDTVPDGEVQLSEDVLDEMGREFFGGGLDEQPNYYDNLSISAYGRSNFYTVSATFDSVEMFDAGGADAWGIAAINSNTFNSLYQNEAYQITLFVDNSYDAEFVLDDLEDLEFNAVYPAAIGNQFEEITRMILTVVYGFLMIGMLVVIYFITYVVLKNVQDSKKKDYLIFRSIGASKKDLSQVTNIELVITMVFAFLITTGFFVLNDFVLYWIPQFLGYFTIFSYLFILVLLFALAILLGNRFNRRIFGRSVITSLKQE